MSKKETKCGWCGTVTSKPHYKGNNLLVCDVCDRKDLTVVQGIVTETIILQKEVSVLVQSNADQCEIGERLRNEAFATTAFQNDDKHGWVPAETINVETYAYVSERNQNPPAFCPGCGKQHSEEDTDGGRCLGCEVSLMPYDPEREKHRFLNKYQHCGVRWVSSWTCECNDKCPECGAEIEPYESEDL